MTWYIPRKCLSLPGGLNSIRQPSTPSGPNPYVGNAAYAQSSGTYFVRFQIGWDYLQGDSAGVTTAPPSVDASWHQLNTARNNALRDLNEEIAAANRLGRRVILFLYQTFPRWSSEATVVNRKKDAAEQLLGVPLQPRERVSDATRL